MIKIRVLNVEKVAAFIRSVPRGAKMAVMRAVAEYLIGDERHGLRHEPSYKLVTRESAYGKSFFSASQRKWFFAALEDGTINPWQDNRTHAIQNGFAVREQANSDWTRVNIENNAPGVGWVMGANQARQPAKVGWRKAWDIIQTNLAGALRAGQSALNAWLKGK